MTTHVLACTTKQLCNGALQGIEGKINRQLLINYSLLSSLATSNGDWRSAMSGNGS